MTDMRRFSLTAVRLAFVAAVSTMVLPQSLHAFEPAHPLRFAAFTDRSIYGLGEEVEITVASLNLRYEDVRYTGLQLPWTGEVVDTNGATVLSFRPPAIDFKSSRRCGCSANPARSRGRTGLRAGGDPMPVVPSMVRNASIRKLRREG